MHKSHFLTVTVFHASSTLGIRHKSQHNDEHKDGNQTYCGIFYTMLDFMQRLLHLILESCHQALNMFIALNFPLVALQILFLHPKHSGGSLKAFHRLRARNVSDPVPAIVCRSVLISRIDCWAAPCSPSLSPPPLIEVELRHSQDGGGAQVQRRWPASVVGLLGPSAEPPLHGCWRLVLARSRRRARPSGAARPQVNRGRTRQRDRCPLPPLEGGQGRETPQRRPLLLRCPPSLSLTATHPGVPLTHWPLLPSPAAHWVLAGYHTSRRRASPHSSAPPHSTPTPMRGTILS